MVMNIDPLGLIEEAIGERKEGVQMLGVGEIKPNPVQPRQTFADDALAELANSTRPSSGGIRLAPAGESIFSVAPDSHPATGFLSLAHSLTPLLALLLQEA